MDSDEIKRIVEEIRKSKVRSKSEYFKKKYKQFEEQYPMLFKTACDDTTDENILYYLINMLEKVQKKEMTEHVASVNVGQKLYDDYVKPLVGETEQGEEPK
jgi:hypothetical protein